jgi:hypothetical protein
MQTSMFDRVVEFGVHELVSTIVLPKSETSFFYLVAKKRKPTLELQAKR